MSHDCTASLYLGCELDKVKWKLKEYKEGLEEYGEVGDYTKPLSEITKIINYDSQDSNYYCGVELESVDWDCLEVDQEVLTNKLNTARNNISIYVDNPEDFKLVLSAEYF